MIKFIIDEIPKIELNIEKYFAEIVAYAFEYENVEISDKEIEISVSFVSEGEIKSINNEFRGIDKVTDVLSFPQYENAVEIGREKYVVLGDVVICLEKAKSQAKEYGHTLEREILYLFTHSIFHLLGYDHMQEDEKSIMRTAEKYVMQKIQVYK